MKKSGARQICSYSSHCIHREEHMKRNKFAFIICTNDTLLLEECLHYIDHLIIPDGFEMDIFT
ncbi:MAG: glycosyltransferase family protein, partial [Acetatifactor sp.]|nr:glycosyltransferase family protein [Acetatifactor sp.]